MVHERRLLCVLAHPDDESLGTGGTLAKYADEGVATYLVCATRGERGRFFDNSNRPPLEEIGRVREQELRAAAQVLRVRETHLLDYIDGDLDQAPPQKIVGEIVSHIRRIRPQVVISFGPEGGYGHPDHIAICQFTTAACACAADAGYRLDVGEPHRVDKFYFMQFSSRKLEAYAAAFRDIVLTIDNQERRSTPLPDWQLTTFIDTKAYWEQVWQAVLCHKTQLAIYRKLEHLSPQHHEFLWGTQEYYRAYSLVNGGRQREHDLFEGLAD